MTVYATDAVSTAMSPTTVPHFLAPVSGGFEATAAVLGAGLGADLGRATGRGGGAGALAAREGAAALAGATGAGAALGGLGPALLRWKAWTIEMPRETSAIFSGGFRALSDSRQADECVVETARRSFAPVPSS